MPGGTQQGGAQAGGEFPGGGQMPGGELPGGTGELPQGGGAPGGAPTGPGGQQGGTGREFPGGGTAPSGGRGGMGGGMGGADSELVSYLKKHQDGAKWLLAVSNSQSAAQIELSAKAPVISMFGFTGSDKAMTLAKLKELVKKGELHYVQTGGGMGMGGGNTLSQEISTWVQKHGTAVKESAYSKSSTSSKSTTSSSTTSTSKTSSSSSLYRLDPSDVT